MENSITPQIEGNDIIFIIVEPCCYESQKYEHSGQPNS